MKTIEVGGTSKRIAASASMSRCLRVLPAVFASSFSSGRTNRPIRSGCTPQATAAPSIS